MGLDMMLDKHYYNSKHGKDGKGRKSLTPTGLIQILPRTVMINDDGGSPEG